MRLHGFTIIELLVVMTIIALLLTIAAPRYFQHVERSREVALRENLRAVREAVDRFYADRGTYPASLQDLVDHKYLRAVPVDPITERTDTWVLVPPKGGGQGVFDLRSGAKGRSSEGTEFASW